MDWLLGNAVGYIKLQVPASHAETAAGILEQKSEERRLRREANESDVDDDLCLACGSAMSGASVCPACGWSWNDHSTDANDAPS